MISCERVQERDELKPTRRIPSSDPAKRKVSADESGPICGEIWTHVTVFWKLCSLATSPQPPRASQITTSVPPALTSSVPADTSPFYCCPMPEFDQESGFKD